MALTSSHLLKLQIWQLPLKFFFHLTHKSHLSINTIDSTPINVLNLSNFMHFLDSYLKEIIVFLLGYCSSFLPGIPTSRLVHSNPGKLFRGINQTMLLLEILQKSLWFTEPYMCSLAYQSFIWFLTTQAHSFPRVFEPALLLPRSFSHSYRVHSIFSCKKSPPQRILHRDPPRLLI